MAKTPIPPTASLQMLRPLKDHYKALVAIPCCNEFDSLPETIQSLEETSPDEYNETLIVVNVNQRATLDRQNNLATLRWIEKLETNFYLEDKTVQKIRLAKIEHCYEHQRFAFWPTRQIAVRGRWHDRGREQ